MVLISLINTNTEYLSFIQIYILSIDKGCVLSVDNKNVFVKKINAFIFLINSPLRGLLVASYLPMFLLPLACTL